MRGMPGHSATTANVQAIYPFQAEAGWGAIGPYIGANTLGSAFCYDPWALYQAGVITNPNIMVIGSIGTGKSALVKTLIWRSMLFKNRRALIVDPKGEYGPLTRALGAEPISLTPGGPIRLNPLHPGAGEESQVRMLEAVASALLQRPLTPVESAGAHEALIEVKRSKSEPTIRDIVETVLRPTKAMAQSLSMNQKQMLEQTRDLALALRRLCEGEMAGMFDGPSTDGVDLSKKVVTLDLSQTGSDTALGIFMACALGWLTAVIAEDRLHNNVMHNFWLYDEAWRLFALHGVAELQQDRMKIARSYGIANIMVMHRISDLHAAANEGTRTQSIVSGFIEDTATHVIYKQAEGAADLLEKHHHVSGTEKVLVQTAPRGTALWVVGNRRFIVRHQLTARERDLVDTDQQMYERQEEMAA